MKVTHNVSGWFEIPVLDMERAIKFYEIVLGYKLVREQMGEQDMAWFPWVENSIGSGGSLVQHPDYKPSQEGVLVYLTAFSGDVSNELSRVELAGGKLLLQKTQISPEHGFYGLFLDTEGNRIAIHSRG
jgi:predicted enzyme related to lactoylglutathione lyase